jgi:PAS domain S-box-containing protein
MFSQFILDDLIHPDDRSLAEATLYILRDLPGDSRTFDIRSRHKEGHWLWLEVTASNQLKNPEIQAILITSRNITTRKISPAKPVVDQLQTIAQDMQRHESQIRSVLDSMKDALLTISWPDRQLIYASASVESIFGYPAQCFIDDPDFFKKVVHPDDLEMANDAMIKGFRDGVVELEHRIILPDGQVRWLFRRAWVTRDERGRPIQINDTAQDITARKQVEAALRTSEELYRSLVESSDAAISLVDSNGHYLYLNGVAAKPFGQPPESLVGKTVSELFPFDNNNIVLSRIQRVIETGQGIIVDSEAAPAGLNAWFRVSVQPVHDSSGKPYAALIHASDITAKKLAEQVALRQNEILQQSRNLIALSDLEGNITFMNKGGTELIGAIDIQQVIGLPTYTFYTPEDMAKIRDEYMPTMLQTGQWHGENRLKTLSGQLIDVDQTIFPIRDPNGAIIEFATIMFDITERKAAEKSLRQSENHLRSLMDSQTAFNIRVDQADLLSYCNRRYTDQFGWLASSLIGIPALNTIYPDDRDKAMAAIRQCMAQPGVPIQLEVRCSTAEGGTFWTHWELILIQDNDGNFAAMQCVGFDITKQKQAEAELHALNEVLEQHVLDRTAELERSQKYLQALHEITVDLTQISDPDQFYKQAVAMAIERLEFDRISLFLYDVEHNMAMGTYGTDQYGHLCAEHAVQFKVTTDGNMWKSLQKPNRYHLLEQTPLVYGHVQVGSGWHVTVPLRSGDQSLGWLVADNLIQHKPVSLLQLEILGQYGVFISASLVRRQVESVLQKTTDQLQAILEHSTAGIFMKDLDGQLLLFNRPADIDLEVIEKLGSTVLPPASDAGIDYVEIPRKISVIDKPVSYEGTVDDHTYWVTNFPIFDDQDQVYAVGGIATDITTRKLYEQSLERALQHEKELGELKSRFVSMASHELRTPLAVILSTTETLSAYRDRLDSTQIDSRLDKIRQQVVHMRDIMEDVLQLTRIQAGFVDFRPILGNLDMLCREIVEEFQNQTKYRERITYHCANSPVLLDFDNRLMRQVISNLLSNALKYSSDEDPVFIDLAQVDTEITLKVSDQGIGIPAVDLPHLFEPFHRAENVGAVSGTGLGLSIAKQSVEAHGGVLTVESQVDEGTTFTVRFPVTTQPH